MHETDTPTNVGSNDGLGLVQDRAAFDRLVLQLTGRDMDYHNRNGTTGLDTAWLCYRAGVAAERERCAQYLRDAADRLAPEGKRATQVDLHVARVMATMGDEIAVGGTRPNV